MVKERISLSHTRVPFRINLSRVNSFFLGNIMYYLSYFSVGEAKLVYVLTWEVKSKLCNISEQSNNMLNVCFMVTVTVCNNYG